MKFSELTLEQWKEWEPYLDTCVLPITGLTGEESPVESADRLERLRDWLDGVEIPFRGRVVTYPAYHFVMDKQPQQQDISLINGVCSRLRERGFAHIVIISADMHITKDMLKAADEVFSPLAFPWKELTLIKEEMNKRIQKMWLQSQTDV
ncbi:DUF2487 family protein [Paenibacillus apiarius]|uniref:YpiF family protein n=1 Tax=Paenibacillus apiarius TaxID=46240 RepID=A0ABT4DSE3_9BACL|nr:DUF2487 family protein [Paenibacillus apiarius]MCY9517092.1 YpiF family protein [Paenibacillus apiarius]MCY9520211.1 YpiF family protein [Paenibacillus apiarius]MCY9554901.1 YpiF family protein [Paenibacillus apiarius]MCY9561412.1 YpiF family protein [Paenibacillus apiarius]MCY9685934.1 YpiF family protein [Paenibacillus apiarius]